MPVALLYVNDPKYVSSAVLATWETAIELLASEVVNFVILNCPVLALYAKSPVAVNKLRIS